MNTCPNLRNRVLRIWAHPSHETGIYIVERPFHLELTRLHPINSYGAGAENVFNSLPYVRHVTSDSNHKYVPDPPVNRFLSGAVAVCMNRPEILFPLSQKC